MRSHRRKLTIPITPPSTIAGIATSRSTLRHAEVERLRRGQPAADQREAGARPREERALVREREAGIGLLADLLEVGVQEAPDGIADPFHFATAIAIEPAAATTVTAAIPINARPWSGIRGADAPRRSR